MTVRVLVALFEDAPVAMTRVILLNPEAVKTWIGFFAVLVVPSPKSHCHDMAFPVEPSENWTACPSTGYLGEYVKETFRLLEVLLARLLRRLSDLVMRVCPVALIVTICEMSTASENANHPLRPFCLALSILVMLPASVVLSLASW
jgi:hypothetical protein